MIRSNPLGAQHDEADVIEPSDSLFNHDELVEKVMAAHEGEEEVDKQLSDSSSSKAALSDHEKGDTVLSQVASEFVTPSHEEVATSKIEEVATSKIEDEATSMIEEVATSKIEEAATSKVEGSSTSAAPVVDVRLDPQAPVSDSSSHTAVRPPEFGEETTDSFMMPRSLSIEEEAERRLSHMESDGKSVFSVKTRRGDKEAVPAAYWERKLMKKNLSEWTLRRPDELFQPRQYQILMHIPQPQSSLSGSTDGPSAVQTTGLQTPRRGFGSRAAPELVSKSGSMAAPELASKSGSRAGPELVSKSGSRSVAVSGSSLAGVAKDKRSGVSSTPIQSGTLDGIKSGSRSGIRSEVRSTVSVARSKPELESSVGSETDAKFVR
ncbi:MAG: hypothetical protein KVP17_001281 [Porospora cf. gigantea B]|nr:MAG: hypothetical protein KVP17_001281 [Porospora cf. gigantea B]